MDSNPRDRARAFTRENFACADLPRVHQFFLYFWAQNHLVPDRVTPVLNEPFSTGHFDRY